MTDLSKLFNNFPHHIQAEVWYAASDLRHRNIRVITHAGDRFHVYRQHRYRAEYGHNGYIQRPYVWSDVTLAASTARPHEHI